MASRSWNLSQSGSSQINVLPGAGTAPAAGKFLQIDTVDVVNSRVNLRYVDEAGTGTGAQDLPVRSIRDFGGSPTNTPAENVAAFQAAIDAGGVIYIDEGEYTFDNILLPKSYCHLLGAGPGRTILTRIPHAGTVEGWEFDNGCLFRHYTNTGNPGGAALEWFTVSDMTLQADTGYYTDGSGNQRFWSPGYFLWDRCSSQNITIARCLFRSKPGTGHISFFDAVLAVAGDYGTLIRDHTIVDCTFDGINRLTIEYLNQHPPWSPNTHLSPNIIVPGYWTNYGAPNAYFTGKPSPYDLLVIQEGTTANTDGTEPNMPVWPSALGEQVTDGTVVYEAIPRQYNVQNLQVQRCVFRNNAMGWSFSLSGPAKGCVVEDCTFESTCCNPGDGLMNPSAGILNPGTMMLENAGGSFCRFSGNKFYDWGRSNCIQSSEIMTHMTGNLYIDNTFITTEDKFPNQAAGDWQGTAISLGANHKSIISGNFIHMGFGAGINGSNCTDLDVSRNWIHALGENANGYADSHGVKFTHNYVTNIPCPIPSQSGVVFWSGSSHCLATGNIFKIDQGIKQGAYDQTGLGNIVDTGNWVDIGFLPFEYWVTTPGTTGSTEPIWPTTPGATVTSGTVTFTCRPFANNYLYTTFAPSTALTKNHVVRGIAQNPGVYGLQGQPKSVLGFGARAGGDPTANTKAFNDAAASGGTIWVPKGTYTVDGTILPRSGVRFVGDGIDQTIIRTIATGIDGSGCVFRLYTSNPCVGVSIEDMTLTADTATLAPGASNTVVGLIWVEREAIRDWLIKRVRFVCDANYAAGASGPIGTNCITLNTQLATQTMSGITIEDCVFDGAAQSGIAILGAQPILWAATTAYALGAWLEMAPVDYRVTAQTGPTATEPTWPKKCTTPGNTVVSGGVTFTAFARDINSGLPPPPVFQASHTYAVNDVVQPTATPAYPVQVLVTQAGTSGSAQPDWPTIGGADVDDGTCKLRAVAPITPTSDFAIRRNSFNRMAYWVGGSALTIVGRCTRFTIADNVFGPTVDSDPASVTDLTKLIGGNQLELAGVSYSFIRANRFSGFGHRLPLRVISAYARISHNVYADNQFDDSLSRAGYTTAGIIDIHDEQDSLFTRNKIVLGETNLNVWSSRRLDFIDNQIVTRNNTPLVFWMDMIGTPLPNTPPENHTIYRNTIDNTQATSNAMPIRFNGGRGCHAWHNVYRLKTGGLRTAYDNAGLNHVYLDGNYDVDGTTFRYSGYTGGGYPTSPAGLTPGQMWLNNGVLVAYAVNQVFGSEAFSVAPWTVFGGGVTVTADTAPGPSGGPVTADTLACTVADTGIFQSVSVSGPQILSVWARLVSGDANFTMGYFNSSTNPSAAFTATTVWQRFFFTFTGSGGFNVFISKAAGQTVPGAVQLWGAQLNAGNVLLPYTPT